MSLSLGSPLYMAPELCAETDYTEKVDVWSAGVIAYILITGKPPFIGKSKDQIYDKIQFSDPDFNDFTLQQCTPHAANFLKRCLAKNSEDRPSVQELLDHPWFQLTKESKNLDNQKVLDISANLASFRKTNAFQTGVLSFITNIQV